MGAGAYRVPKVVHGRPPGPAASAPSYAGFRHMTGFQRFGVGFDFDASFFVGLVWVY